MATNVTQTFFPDREHLDRYIDRIYASGWMTNNGALVNELEKRLCNFLGVKFLVPVANGTLALQVALKVMGIKGDVLTTPFSFVATTNSLIWEHLNPVFVDINPATLNLDPRLVESRITPETSAILPVHVFGNACEVDLLAEIAERHKVKILYDAAHAFSVSNKESSLLNFGDASVLSFHATKIFHTIEGGAIIFRNEEDYFKAKLMINFGISGYDKVDLAGINCKMNEFQAAMGLAVLDQFEKLNLARKQVWERYRERFSDTGIGLQVLNDRFKSNYSYFPVIFESEEQLLIARQQLNEQEIFPRRYFYPSLNLLDYLSVHYHCPISESVSKRILCLPLFPGLDENIQEKIIQVVSNNIANSNE